MHHSSWDDSLATGDSLVDEQHRELVDLFDRLAAVESASDSPEIVQDALERLADYVVSHFAAEEALMERVGYPPSLVLAHVEEHRNLTARTRDLILRYRTGEVDSVLTISDFLKTWLRSHIEHVDRRLVEYARESA